MGQFKTVAACIGLNLIHKLLYWVVLPWACMCCWRILTHSSGRFALQTSGHCQSLAAHQSKICPCLFSLRQILAQVSALTVQSCSKVFRVSNSAVYAAMNLDIAVVRMHHLVGHSLRALHTTSSEPKRDLNNYVRCESLTFLATSCRTRSNVWLLGVGISQHLTIWLKSDSEGYELILKLLLMHLDASHPHFSFLLWG